MTNSTCVCGRPFHRHDILNVVVDSLSNGCKKFTPTPTQIKASETAEGEECEHVFGGLRGDDWGNPRSFCKLCDRIYDPAKPAASQQAPADHPDLVSEAEAFLVRKYGIPLKNFRGHHKQWARDIAEFARQQATSPDAVIDETAADRIKPHVRELLCQRCEQEYPVWFAPNDLWNATAKDGEHFFCLTCFAVLAEERGIIKPTAWKVEPETKRPEAPDDLIAEAKAFWMRPDNFNKPRQELMASFAQLKLQQATRGEAAVSETNYSPDAVIDEFVERVKEPFEYRSRVSDDEWRESLRSVAEEMKRK